MAVYFAHKCGRKGCGRPVVTCDKTKRYVHADRGTRFRHDVTKVVTAKLGTA